MLHCGSCHGRRSCTLSLVRSISGPGYSARRFFLASRSRRVVFTLSETRLEILGKWRLGMQRPGTRNQCLFGLKVVWVRNAAVHRTDRSAGLIVVKTNAFGA